ncbi:ADP-ribosyltransferase [Hymenobacter metallicola]|uniref:ADP ribosyltransferase domain-containing protein n=1 Tax=Hymenobacter metallicola TaxID=2563114 RepID=A0A4Z0Q486_9BACT|nr:ADP-ribosyltransferase [Hymenobacter metallicola]TGE23532.1 hypothetical protein E5K02_20315 [Hymenobacter metallicola]
MPTLADFELLYELNSQQGRFLCGGRPCFHVDKEVLAALHGQDIDYLTKRFLDTYTDLLSSPLNKYLRQEAPRDSALLAHCHYLLDSCLDEAPTYSENVVYRIEQSAFVEQFRAWFKDRIGSIVQIPCFWSTYRNPKYWKHAPALYQIKTSADTQARNISAYAPKAILRNEAEVLFKSGTCFFVESVGEQIHLLEVAKMPDHRLVEDCHMAYWQDDEANDKPSASELGLI